MLFLLNSAYFKSAFFEERFPSSYYNLSSNLAKKYNKSLLDTQPLKLPPDEKAAY